MEVKKNYRFIAIRRFCSHMACARLSEYYGKAAVKKPPSLAAIGVEMVL